MTPAVLRFFATFVERPPVATGTDLHEIAPLSQMLLQNSNQIRLVGGACHRARKPILTDDDWNIRHPWDHGLDLVVACNVLHHVSNVYPWTSNRAARPHGRRRPVDESRSPARFLKARVGHE
jgi:hypothetical protein